MAPKKMPGCQTFFSFRCRIQPNVYSDTAIFFFNRSCISRNGAGEISRKIGLINRKNSGQLATATPLIEMIDADLKSNYL